LLPIIFLSFLPTGKVADNQIIEYSVLVCIKIFLDYFCLGDSLMMIRRY
jgi:hypothetical protein